MKLAGRTPAQVKTPTAGNAAAIAVRPELVMIEAEGAAKSLGGKADVTAPATVKNRIFLGEQTEYLVEADGLGEILVRAPKHAEATTGGFNRGDRVLVGWRNASALALGD